jgi:hypothetical protein
MNWGDVGKTLLSGGASILGTMLLGPVGGVAAGSLVANLVGSEDNPEAAAKALSLPGAMDALVGYEKQHGPELEKLAMQYEAAALAEVNSTFRSEHVAGDKFVRRWRPFFGYILSVTWGLQGLGIAMLIVGLVFGLVPDPAVAVQAVATLIAALGTQWGVALAVLGVSTVQRSRDKARLMGMPMGGILGGLIKKVIK